MRLKSLILILTFIIMGAGFISWSTDSNQRYGFSNVYPSDWKSFHKGSTVIYGNEKALENSADDRSLQKGEYKVLITCLENKDNLSLEKWVNQEESLSPANCRKENMQSITVDSLPAKKIKALCEPQWGYPEAPCFINVYFIKEGQLFWLQYLGGDFDKEGIFDRMVESFTWTKIDEVILKK